MEIITWNGTIFEGPNISLCHAIVHVQYSCKVALIISSQATRMKYNASWKDIRMALSFRIVFGQRTDLWQEDGLTNLLFQPYKDAPEIAAHMFFEFQIFQEDIGNYGSGSGANLFAGMDQVAMLTYLQVWIRQFLVPPRRQRKRPLPGPLRFSCVGKSRKKGILRSSSTNH